MQSSFFLPCDEEKCEFLMADEVQNELDEGEAVVSATFVTPYPPGFPVLVPGELFSWTSPDVHGYAAGA